MAFYESPRFPERISFGATGGAAYQTDVIVVSSGAEFRNALWSQARASYDVAHAARKEADFKILQAFFRTMKGRLHGFRFKDWSDYQVTAGQGIVTAGQLYKRYTSGSQTEDRLISKPVAGSVTITGGGSLNTATGVITGGAPTAWVGEFDVPCRFDIDAMRGTIIDRNLHDGLIMGWDAIPIVEIRV